METSDFTRKQSRSAAVNMRHKRALKKQIDNLTKDFARDMESRDIYTRTIAETTRANALPPIMTTYTSRPVSKGLQTREDFYEQRNAILANRVSHSGLPPSSEEYAAVMRDLKALSQPQGTQTKPGTKAGRSKPKRISFSVRRSSNAVGRSDDMTYWRSMPGFTSPTASSLNKTAGNRRISCDIQTRNNHYPLGGIKEAWKPGGNSPANTSKSERRRHLSLPAPPPGFYFEISRGQDKTRAKSDDITQNNHGRSTRKISTVTSPNIHGLSAIYKRTQFPNSTSPRVETVSGAKVKHSSGNMSDCGSGETGIVGVGSGSSTGASLDDKMSAIRIDCESNEEAQAGVEMGDFQTARAMAASGADLHPKLLLGINQAGVKKVDDFRSSQDTPCSQAAVGTLTPNQRARRNFRRLGRAAIAARRLLGINKESTEKRRLHAESSFSEKSNLAETRKLGEILEEEKMTEDG